MEMAVGWEAVVTVVGLVEVERAEVMVVEVKVAERVEEEMAVAMAEEARAADLAVAGLAAVTEVVARGGVMVEAAREVVKRRR